MQSGSCRVSARSLGGQDAGTLQVGHGTQTTALRIKALADQPLHLSRFAKRRGGSHVKQRMTSEQAGRIPYAKKASRFLRASSTLLAFMAMFLANAVSTIST